MDLDDSFLQSSGGRSLAWLADAPMFIDSDQVSALYNAVAKPEFETESITLNVEDSKEFTVEGKAGIEGSLSVAEWLKTIFPFLDAEVKVTGELGGSGVTATKKGNEIELRPVNTPQRQLVQLALHYWINIPHRAKAVSDLGAEEWIHPEFVTKTPRALVFLDCPPYTPFIPMATEVTGGNVQIIYPNLIAGLPEDTQKKAPEYPEPAKYKDSPDTLEKMRREYWEFFSNNFASTTSMEAVEKTISEAKAPIHWIDYRVPLPNAMPFLHLHISPRGQYDTGTFAYQLVKRGYKHGLRLVGTMKSEPAMNVLAIFEK